MNFKSKILALSVFFLVSCSKSYIYKTESVTSITVVKPKSSKLTIEQVNVWQHKDIINDSIPGISLDKAYSKLLENKKCDTTIIAVIDTRIDINHEDFKKFIWVNKNEVPNNGIDDDRNGYVDDVNGWNFLADKKGNNIIELNYSFVRYIRKFDKQFKDKSSNQIKQNDLTNYKLYQKAVNKLKDELFIVNDNISYIDSLLNDELSVVARLKSKMPNIDLDSLDLSQIKDSMVSDDIKKYKYYLKAGKLLKNRKENEVRKKEFHLNVHYNENEAFGDDISNIKDLQYGNNDVSGDTNIFYHSTQVTGVIVADRNNNKGIKGITNSAKIMPVCVSPVGDERDKDIALGIRYAVDNGASIINITFTKSFPIDNNLVISALKYAAKNDVLIVSSSGNDSMNLDIDNSYPNDSGEDKVEFIDNFIKVGAIWFKINEDFVPEFSNYGKREVDIFAPGKYIYTTHPNNNYKHVDGTSFSAPIVTGIAALIRSYYPNLTAAEVKQIIMESGVSYNIMVNKPSTSEEKELVSFSSLSKSGKIVNAYNALLMAEEISKKKKKNK